MFDWLIIGGGIHGTHLGIQLKASGQRNFRIIDPHSDLLYNWKWCTCNTKMQYLRSPGVHHVGVEPLGLRKYAKTTNRKSEYISPNHRPSLSLFNSYTTSQIERYELDNYHIEGKAYHIEIKNSKIYVFTDTEVICTKKLMLAVGRSNQLRWPDWAKKLKHKGTSVNHIFDTDFKTREVSKNNQKIIVGGGQSGAQLALALSKKCPGNITMLTRRPLKKRFYDTPPGWMGPKFLGTFYNESDYSSRRKMIREARNPGTMTPHMYRAVKKAIKDDKIRHIIDDVSEAIFFTQDLIQLELLKKPSIAANHIILATGFSLQRPGGAFVDGLIENYGLRCAECGYPVVSPTLEWGHGIYVTGPLAELELGPAAPNIIGVRHSSRRMEWATDAN